MGISESGKKVLRKVTLKIASPARLVNQIAGTYKDVYRAMMEYVDNAADAAVTSSKKPRHLVIVVDRSDHTVTFEDDCQGMAPQELGELLESIGKSRKAHLPWVNGEFGFGVHAFRAFAQYAEFTSRSSRSETSTILIDREADENQEVEVCKTETKAIAAPAGTKVTISGFRKGVFKGDRFAVRLREEIEAHFDDVIHSGILEIVIQDTRDGVSQPCRPLDVTTLSGASIKKTVNLEVNSKKLPLSVDIKILDNGAAKNPAALTKNGRRILPVGELRSLRNYLRGVGKTPDIWNHPALAGRIEIGDLAKPNITRDDLQDDEGRETLFEALSGIQDEVEVAISALQSRRRDKSLNAASKALSERLSHVLRRFAITFRKMVAGSSGSATTGGTGTGGLQPGGEEPGGGGPGEVPGAGGDTETGTGGTGLGKGGLGKGSRGASPAGGAGSAPLGLTPTRGGPEILFAHLAPEIRCQQVGHQITVNVDHPAFKERAPTDGSLDERLLNHIARVISPSLTQKLYESEHQIPTPLEFAEKSVELSIAIEDDFMDHEKEIATAMMAEQAEGQSPIPEEKGAPE